MEQEQALLLGTLDRDGTTVLDEFYRVAFRKKLYRTIAELQADLDQWLRHYNEARPHQGRWCYGKTPIQTFLDSLPLARVKLIDQHHQAHAGRLLIAPVRRPETSTPI